MTGIEMTPLLGTLMDDFISAFATGVAGVLGYIPGLGSVSTLFGYVTNGITALEPVLGPVASILPIVLLAGIIGFYYTVWVGILAVRFILMAWKLIPFLGHGV